MFFYRVTRVWVFCSVLFGLGGVIKASDFQILESNEQQFVCVFQPQEMRTRTMQVQGRTYQLINFLNAAFDGAPGVPQAPYRVLTLGVPSQGSVTVEVIRTESEEISNIVPLPVPYLVRAEGIPMEIYRENPDIYTGDQWYPSRIIQVDPPGYSGDLRVVQIRIYPFQFLPSQQKARRFTKIVLRVTFPRPSGRPTLEIPTRLPEYARSFYRDVILNFPVAQRWMVSPPRRLSKRWRVFQKGERFKIPVRTEGIYKISGQFLADHGIDIQSIQPSTLKIYNNGGRELPRKLTAPRPDSLIENAIWVVGVEDGRFDPEDYLLFYGRPVDGWSFNSDSMEYSHYINHYTTTNIYWLVFNDDKPGKRMRQVPAPPEPGLPIRRAVRDRIFVEEELININHSGTEWLSRQFLGREAIDSLVVNLPGAVTSDPISLKIRLFGHSFNRHVFSFFFNGHFIGMDSLTVSQRLRTIALDGIVPLRDGFNTLTLEYRSPKRTSVAYLDWLELEYTRRLEAQDDFLIFDSPLEDGIFQYEITGFSQSPIYIFDVTDFANVTLKTDTDFSNGTLSFSDTSRIDAPRRYVCVAPSAFLTPEDIMRDEASDLRNPQNAADFVIITHQDFYSAALTLKGLREGWDGLQTYVAKIQDVFDEFSWGLYDPTAIRDFLSYAYHNWTRRPYYVLLLGDGDFDYKNILSDADENWIPPYETSGERSEFLPGSPQGENTVTRCTDDWFTYVHGNDYIMDMAIGRIPARTTTEAEEVVKKIVAYQTAPEFGAWRNTVTMVGDDELVLGCQGNETFHEKDIEYIAERFIPKVLDIKKIYLTEYPAVYDASVAGCRKPRATEDLLRQINQGTLILNFMGHGNYELWTHERVLLMSRDMPRIQNGLRMPFVIAATCDFGRFDSPTISSMGEALLLVENRGAIGMLTATRLAYSTANAAFNGAFYQQLFQGGHSLRRLGDAVRRAKMITRSPINDEKYHLFGDPTLRLALPPLEVVIESLQPDTLKALGLISVTGSIRLRGQPLADFDGQGILQAYDSKRKTTYVTQKGSKISYLLPGRPIFRGRAEIQDGRFHFQFIVPKDITYGGTLGRISLYVWNGTQDGSGYREPLYVGGTATGIPDREGPDIHITFKGQEFAAGDVVGPDPTLLVTIADAQSGVNITGEIGHKITLILDERKDQKYDLTPFFDYDVGSYLSGTIEYPLTGLSPGWHSVTIKAWDNANNSSEASTTFRVESLEELRLQDVLNYPNPFSSQTTFTFQINREAEVEIKIYTLSGRLIRTLEPYLAQVGFNMISWDGRDADGDPLANGVYLYKIRARSYTGSKELETEVIGKLMVMR